MTSDARIDERPVGRAEDFLQIEENAQRLLDELAELKRETESYRAARTSLDDTVRRVDSLTRRLEDVATGVHDAATSLREIGTPRLLEEQRGLAATVGALLADISTLRGTVETQAERSTHSTTALQNALAQHITSVGGAIRSDLVAEIGSARDVFLESVRSLDATASAHLKLIQEEAAQRIAATKRALRTLGWVVVVTVPIASALVTVATIRFLGG